MKIKKSVMENKKSVMENKGGHQKDRRASKLKQCGHEKDVVRK
jgi:hypothetical protein